MLASALLRSSRRRCSSASSPVSALRCSRLAIPSPRSLHLAMASAAANSHLLADSPPTICPLVIEPHWSSLSPKEKLYAHHISRAVLEGSRVTLRQVSPESENIFDLAVELHRAVNGDWAKLTKETGVSDEDMKYWLEYAASVLANLGNYKSFGDQKFVPRVPRESLAKIAGYTPKTKTLFEAVADAVYATEPAAHTLLGYPDAGHVSTYYPFSPDITRAEISAVQAFMETKGILPENTRLQKKSPTHFILWTASAATDAPADQKTSFKLPDGKTTLEIKYGDHTAEMAKIVTECKAAGENAANDTQKNMYAAYARSFETGSLEAHKDAQKIWVTDSPRVESNIGFIETYRDPHGVRGEWEGFVAVVNGERTRIFGEMVRRAAEFIPRLPWPSDFEKDAFLKPDFTSLEVLTFAGSGIPAGINLPNYDDIRQNVGFKNVSLGNVLSAKAPNEKVTFLKEEDIPLYEKLRGKAFEVQVGIHELLGHGTGKLLQETSPGNFNFTKSDPPLNPVTGEKVKTWYKPGQTWGSVFGGIAGSYEECRAECVAMYLGGELDLLSIFGFTDTSADKPDDVLYVEYLQMARAGLLALEYWDPKSRKWGQAHMQARYSILKSFLSAGPEFITLQSSRDDHDDLVIALDRTKIRSHAKPAVGKYLQKLHVFKSTADYDAGKKLYDEMTHVGDDMAKYREVVMRKKQPRKAFLMANTVLKEDGEVELREYPSTPEGMVQSYAERNV